MFVDGDHRRGNPPTVDTGRAQSTFRSLHRAIQSGLVRSCHDLSEGGLAVALAEMAFAGEFGGQVDLTKIPIDPTVPPSSDFSRLFSESNSRFVCEVEPTNREAFERAMPAGLFACIGSVEATPRLQITSGTQTVLNEDIFELKRIWQQPLDWS
jgi:phosphoribosylformylglycinamidine synthase